MHAEVYVYPLDIFHPTDLRRDEVLKAFDKDLKKPFDLVREIVEQHGIRSIRNVEFYDALFEDEDEFLIEYYVEFSRGRIAVKIIGSEYPQQMLRRYYAYVQRRI